MVWIRNDYYGLRNSAGVGLSWCPWTTWQAMQTFLGATFQIESRTAFSCSGVSFWLANCLAISPCLLPGPWHASHVVPFKSAEAAAVLKPVGVPKPVVWHSRHLASAWYFA